MKLISAVASPFGRKVAIVARECGLADRIEFVPTAVVPTNPNKDVARDNPLIKIPVLVTDEGESLFDSLVICDYLDSLHPGEKVIPSAQPARRTALKLHALGSGIADAAVLSRYETVVRPENLRWPEWVSGQMAKINGSLDWLEANVAVLGSATAPRASIGQVGVACALGYLDFRFAAMPWRPTRPKLAAWFAGFSQRASMRETMPVA